MHLIFAERDGALDETRRAALELHLAQCPACRQMRANLSATVAGWRASTAGVGVPDAGLEWQRLRRRLPAGARRKPRRIFRPVVLAWFAVPLAAAAAVLFLFVTPRAGNSETPAKVQDVARADFVEVGSDSTSVVFVDDKSGWLVVWADKPGHG